MRISQARLLCLMLMAGEVLDGILIYLLDRFKLVHIQTNLQMVRPLFYAGAGIVLVVLILKKTMLKPSRFLNVPQERVLPSILQVFVILSALASTIAVLGIVLYILGGTLKFSLVLVLVSLITTFMTYPFKMAVEGLLLEVKRKKEMMV